MSPDTESTSPDHWHDPRRGEVYGHRCPEVSELGRCMWDEGHTGAHRWTERVDGTEITWTGRGRETGERAATS